MLVRGAEGLLWAKCGPGTEGYVRDQVWGWNRLIMLPFPSHTHWVTHAFLTTAN